MKPFERALLINPPVSRPNTNEVPSESGQDSGSHFIPVPRGCSTVIGRTIAFDTGQIITRPIRMDHAQIDSKPRHADLRHHDPAFPPQAGRDRLLEGGFVAAN